MSGQSSSALNGSGETTLAHVADFALGIATVRPSLRTVEGPLGSVSGEPRVIQVLVALANARGGVLSRDDLLRLCWGGRIVGNDAINRAIAEVRRIADAVGADFEVKTVPRVGYRLVGAVPNSHPRASGPDVVPSMPIDRRKLLAGGVLAVSLVAGGAAALIHSDRQSEIDDLIMRGRALRGTEIPGGDQRAEALFRQAIAGAPGRADAWGSLATVLEDKDAARDAAQRALRVDPREANARVVLAYQRLDLEAWTKWEDALLGILADAPDNGPALSHLTMFYQGMGRCRDSWATNERAIRTEPFNPTHQHRRALKHWIFGQIGDADKVADQAMRLWPRHPTVWNARMLTYAYTDRASAAIALLDDVASRPGGLKQPSIRFWRAALNAIASRSRKDIAAALAVGQATAGLAPGLAANAIMLFSYLGEIDAAYRIADGLFGAVGAAVQRVRGKGIGDIYSDTAWGRSQFLFIPATTAFRTDDRFLDFCERTGHVAYWEKRQIWPDAFVRGALDRARLS